MTPNRAIHVQVGIGAPLALTDVPVRLLHIPLPVKELQMHSFGAQVTGLIYTDGSALNGNCKLRRRAGWSIVVTGAAGMGWRGCAEDARSLDMLWWSRCAPMVSDPQAQPDAVGNGWADSFAKQGERLHPDAMVPAPSRHACMI
eukprot:776064-Amphidinium_carterae.1